jgi:uncharacterized protein DUF4115
MRLTVPQLAFVTVGLAAFAALVLLSLPLWRDYRREGRTPKAVAPPPPLVEAKTGPAPPTRGVVRTAPRPGMATLRLVAAHGNSWIVVRTGSSTGAVRYAGVLEQGRALRFTGRRLWLNLGAAGNLEATLNGKPIQTFPIGTIDIVVTAKGIGQAQTPTGGTAVAASISATG